MPLTTLADLNQARRRLNGIAYHTPLVRSASLSRNGADVRYKAENLQPIGSFKIRGAYNRIAALPPEQRAQGVIAYSSGNHAQGVAFAARQLGINAVIVMPTNAPAIKIEQTRALGGQLVMYDPAVESREDVTARLMDGQHWTLVPPFNDADVIAGQGTAGLEILDDWPSVGMVIAPVGGGGLISGVAAALKLQRPAIKIIGVEPELADDARQSLHSGHIVSLSSAQTARTLADGVRTQAVGPLTFAHMTALVDNIVTVSEAELRQAARYLIMTEKLVAEPTGALPLAAWLFRRALLPAVDNVALIVTGGNLDTATLIDLIS